VWFAVLLTPLEAGEPSTPYARQLDQLFNRLSHAASAEDTAALRLSIEQIWLKGDGPTLSLLMSRAQTAMQKQNYAVAVSLLNHLVKLAPDWAEAWNRRAAVRYQLNDEAGALTDIRHALQLEPRHFDAWIGEGTLLVQQGKKVDALQAYTHALVLCPQWPELQKRVQHLQLAVEGQDI